MMGREKQQDIDFFYVARQPIFDRNGKTIGYELLFRDRAGQERADIKDYDQATMNVVTAGFLKNQDAVDQYKRIFINFTGSLIALGSPRALPPVVTVIEVQDIEAPTESVLKKISSLQEEGYRVAVDNYEGDPHHDSLIQLADIAKIDVLHKSEEEIAVILGKLGERKVQKLAYRVDSKTAYETMKRLGFDLFQGYFFARPENLTGRTIKSFQVTKLKILAAIDDPELEVNTLVELVTSDPGITYRLLRLLNSVAFGFVTKIESVRHSITLLGMSRIRHWLRMVVLSDLMSTDKPQELFVLSLNRGKLLEELGNGGQIKNFDPESLFLFGMFSLLDVMLDLEFTEILKKLPLPNDFEEGYTNQDAPMASYIRLFKALEGADIRELLDLCHHLEIKPQAFAEAAVQANSWTDSIVSELL